MLMNKASQLKEIVRWIFSTYLLLTRSRTTGYTNKFYSFVDDCYFKVWVEETVSGYKEAFVFRFDESVVTGITVDNTEMEF